MIQTAILGASGYVGAELLRLCAGHPRLNPVKLFGDSRAGERLAAVHPQLALEHPDALIEAYKPAALDGIDLIFAALPHGQSQTLAAEILGRGIPLVDLGADFRLNDAGTYARWYGETHHAPEQLGSFVYGLPELHREAIVSAKAVAAPGCYATAAILALKPLLDLVEPGSIIVNAASGVTGAGRAATESTHFATVDGNFTAYGLLNHRHTAEMEMELGEGVLFTPHLAPMNRGILATCTATAKRSCDPLKALGASYAGERFIHVSEQSPSTKWTLGSNAVHLTARFDQRTGKVLAIAALDNLGKGAAGQAVQNANLALGLDETAGLRLQGVLV